MNKISVLFLMLFVMFAALPANALIVPPHPGEGRFISDTVDIIEVEDEIAIQQLASRLLQDHQITMVVATIDSLLNYTDGEYLGIEGYSKKLFNYWRIGHASHNYGILLLVSKDDKIARIQFGSGWGYVYDEQAQKIMDETIIPFFSKREFSKGIVAGVNGLDGLARIELKYVISKSKIVTFALAFGIAIICILWLLFQSAASEVKSYQKIYCALPSIFLILGFACNLFGVLNHIEFLLSCVSLLSITIISIFVYMVDYSQKTKSSDTLVQLAIIVVTMLFLPIVLLIVYSKHLGSDAGYGDGNADFGGGATGSWD